MKPTEVLMSEHRVIERVLVCLERMATAARDGGVLSSNDALAAVDFLRTFADQCHHAKEEAQLFPLMERHGLSRQAGPTAVMRQEHEIGRAHVRAMGTCAERAAGGSQADLDDFVRHALDFVLLLREHIAKEDQILFPMADRLLDAAAQEELSASFEHVETHDVGEGTHERYLALADDLCERYGVTEDDVPRGSTGCPHA